MATDTKEPVYHLLALDRVRGVDYPQISETIIATIKWLQQESGTTDGPHLCLDASGLGAPIRDYLKQSPLFRSPPHGYGATPRKIYPVVFTGGESARYDSITGNYNISKSLIVGNFLSLMQHRRFDYAPDLQALPLLEEEIAAFKRHTTTSGKNSFDAEAGAHDDLICAICIPLIVGELRYNKPKPRPVVVPLPRPDQLVTPAWKIAGYNKF
ncbi:hypothetical protein [Methanothrix soehngenii]|uniref:hypothetical protein n=1 Tax=Methanothrix soehngenii TaxID=2223 RepID=UPI002FD8E6AC